MNPQLVSREQALERVRSLETLARIERFLEHAKVVSDQLDRVCALSCNPDQPSRFISPLGKECENLLALFQCKPFPESGLKPDGEDLPESETREPGSFSLGTIFNPSNLRVMDALGNTLEPHEVTIDENLFRGVWEAMCDEWHHSWDGIRPGCTIVNEVGLLPMDGIVLRAKLSKPL